MLAIINSNQKGSLAATQRYTTGIYRTTSKSPAGSHLSASFIGSVRIVFFISSLAFIFRNLPERARAQSELYPLGFLPDMLLICFSILPLTSWVLKSETRAEEPGPIHRPTEP